jgi:hypothetical protein
MLIVFNFFVFSIFLKQRKKKLVLCFAKMNQRTISLDLRSSEMNLRSNFVVVLCNYFLLLFIIFLLKRKRATNYSWSPLLFYVILFLNLFYDKLFCSCCVVCYYSYVIYSTCKIISTYCQSLLSCCHLLVADYSSLYICHYYSCIIC